MNPRQPTGDYRCTPAGRWVKKTGGTVTLFRAYPDGVDTWTIVEKERTDPDYRTVLRSHNDYNRAIYRYVHEEAMSGRGVMISLTENYRHTDHGDPMVALKSFITSPFADEESVELVVRKVLEAREKVKPPSA